MDDQQYLALIVGGVVGGFALLFLIPALIVTICITVVVVCICNKHCPLYSQRQSRRRQPQVGVLVTVDCEEDDNTKNRSIKYHAIETTQGTNYNSSYVQCHAYRLGSRQHAYNKIIML